MRPSLGATTIGTALQAKGNAGAVHFFDTVRPHSFRMRDDGEEDVSFAVDLKVESVPVIHPRLPNVVRLVVFLRSERWMSNIGKQKGQLLVEFGLMLGRKMLVLFAKAEREGRSHAVRRRSARTVA